MKISFPLPDDDEYHQFCINPGCHAETVDGPDGSGMFHCRTCGEWYQRRVVIEPVMKWWVADDGEYWHESAGVFVRVPDGRFLFFRRAIYPVGTLVVPSGHVDAGESPAEAAARELREETGLTGLSLRRACTFDIVGDSCRRGSDAHRWHAFRADIDQPVEVQINGEGKDPVWLTSAEAGGDKLSYPVRYVFERCAELGPALAKFRTSAKTHRDGGRPGSLYQPQSSAWLPGLSDRECSGSMLQKVLRLVWRVPVGPHVGYSRRSKVLTRARSCRAARSARHPVKVEVAGSNPVRTAVR
jgi:8-oxo-dGTP pyrophosphatase MutT (NUDIX family)